MTFCWLVSKGNKRNIKKKQVGTRKEMAMFGVSFKGPSQAQKPCPFPYFEIKKRRWGKITLGQVSLGYIGYNTG